MADKGLDPPLKRPLSADNPPPLPPVPVPPKLLNALPAFAKLPPPPVKLDNKSNGAQLTTPTIQIDNNCSVVHIFIDVNMFTILSKIVVVMFSALLTH
jgi:hypothetical protein